MTKTLHASCVAVEDRGLMIIGKSGSGKSSLALQLMAFGAELVADDRVVLEVGKQGLTVSAPEQLSGLIEARGIGVLNASTVAGVLLRYVVDLDNVEQDRLPIQKTIMILGQNIPLLYNVDSIHFAAGLWQFLRHGRSDR